MSLSVRGNVSVGVRADGADRRDGSNLTDAFQAIRDKLKGAQVADTSNVGVKFSGKLGPVSADCTAGVVTDDKRHVALYASCGADAVSTGVGASAQVVGGKSNAKTISDFGGAFCNAVVSGGDGPHASVEAYNGKNSDGSDIKGVQLGLGVGVGVGVGAGCSWTEVVPLRK